jgi:hypothetical protein
MCEEVKNNQVMTQQALDLLQKALSLSEEERATSRESATPVFITEQTRLFAARSIPLRC